VTGWFVMQLKSAKVAGLQVDGAGFKGAAAWLEKVTDKEGHAGYTAAAADQPSMTAVALVCRQFMGADRADPLLTGAADHLLKNLPRWQDNDRRDFYYIYYGTLGMFQMGGDGWKQWNEALKPALVNNQCKGGPTDGSDGDRDGSWDPWGTSGKAGGRVFQTAAGALILEVYYRYLPLFGK
jgi:hypothetical protein